MANNLILGQTKAKLALPSFILERFKAAVTYSSSSSSSCPLTVPRTSPWLMVPSNNDKKSKSSHRPYTFEGRSFFDLSKKNFVTTTGTAGTIQENLKPKAVPRCIGSSHGWVAFVDPADCSLHLSNPTPSSSQLLPLPPIETLPAFSGKLFRESASEVVGFMRRGREDGEEYPVSCKDLCKGSFFDKLILSSPPYLHNGINDQCIAALTTHSERTTLAFCKLGDEGWTKLETKSCLRDIVYSSHEQKFYSLLNAGTYIPDVEVWDFKDHRFPKRTDIVAELCNQKFSKSELAVRDSCLGTTHYLVESRGEILLVVRHYAHHVADNDTVLKCNDDPDNKWPYKTLRFDVHKLNADGGSKFKFEYVKCLDDRALFVGANHSFSLSTTEYPEIKGNSIYFTDNVFKNDYHFAKVTKWDPQYPYGGHDFGVFDLEDNSISNCYPCETKLVSPELAPVWISPC